MDQVVVAKLLERYSHLHPLILRRSVERAKSLGELFDFFDGFPIEMPVTWDEANRKWSQTDLLLTKKP
jgi:hypothetical protein